MKINALDNRVEERMIETNKQERKRQSPDPEKVLFQSKNECGEMNVYFFIAVLFFWKSVFKEELFLLDESPQADDEQSLEIENTLCRRRRSKSPEKNFFVIESFSFFLQSLILSFSPQLIDDGRKY